MPTKKKLVSIIPDNMPTVTTREETYPSLVAVTPSEAR